METHVCRCYENGERAKQQLASIKGEQNRIKAEQSRLATMQRRAVQAHARTEVDLNAAIVSYSQSLCRPFFDSLREVLPVEIRDMIYADLLSIESSDSKAIHNHPDNHLNIFPQAPHQFTDPYFIQTAYVGDEARAELLNLIYRQHFQKCEYDLGVESLHALGTMDTYDTGLKPLRVVRDLTLCWAPDQCEPLRDPEFTSDKTLAGTPWRLCFEHLLSVEQKAGFRFKLEVILGLY
ncbi:hypothetical protein BDV96DRAFT_231229 [Lophiotrema nucula]|uniref:Uncharacterized protein n=1 Tax=Lophiotrema nucula TaxID=690887 RepID=A0A6A5YR71_9PLEO|nr:hypothetical protein BDV96DRAFT_231229 [Lophiotrema nucula]